jgi:hypothetical protein
MANSSKPSSIDVTVSSDTGFVRELALFDSVMMVVGVMMAPSSLLCQRTYPGRLASPKDPTKSGKEGQVTMFVAVDNCANVGIPEARRATHFEALEPIR